MNARILLFELPPDWEQPLTDLEKKTRRLRGKSGKESLHRQNKSKKVVTLRSEQIVAARKKLQLSQRELAEKMGKSQSWIRDIENGRFQAKAEDQVLLRKVLDLG